MKSDTTDKDITIPYGFPYLDVIRKGKPHHEDHDAFRSRHPSMPCSQRAKIFAPFDALRGFRELIQSMNDPES